MTNDQSFPLPDNKYPVSNARYPILHSSASTVSTWHVGTGRNLQDALGSVVAVGRLWRKQFCLSPWNVGRHHAVREVLRELEAIFLRCIGRTKVQELQKLQSLQMFQAVIRDLGLIQA